MPIRHRGEVEVQFYPYSTPELEGLGGQRHAPAALNPQRATVAPNINRSVPKQRACGSVVVKALRY